MRVGILTLQYAFNYGALLQAYALKTYLESQGHDVEIINYNTSYLYLKNRDNFAKVKTLIWSVFRNALGGRKKYVKMDEFRLTHLHLKPSVIDTRESLNCYVEKFDALIVGSDQVWNPEIIGYDTSYLLDLKNAKRKISYAASIGKSEISAGWEMTLRNKLDSFYAVSTRENTAKRLLEKTGVLNNIIVTLDPVFLLTREQWGNIAKKSRVLGKYILCYVMPGDHILEKRINAMAIRIHKETSLQIVYIGRKEYYRLVPGGIDIVDASPEEFVDLIKNAEYVITNSFHGTAFSIIFQRNFYSLVNKKVSGGAQLGYRVIDLLVNLKLDARIVDGNQFDTITNIDYSISNIALTNCIEISKKYLYNALI